MIDESSVPKEPAVVVNPPPSKDVILEFVAALARAAAREDDRAETAARQVEAELKCKR